MNHTKTCTVCQETFPATAEYFNKHKDGKYGLMAKCKPCHKTYNQSLYQKHQQKRVIEKRKYRERCYDKVLQSSRKCYQKHRDKRLEEKRVELKLYPEKIKQRRREQYVKHREKRLADVREYQKKNKEKRREYTSNYILNRYHNDPLFKIKMNLSRRMRSLIKKDGTKTVELIGCTVDYLKQHLESKFTEGMTWNNYGRNGWHIDHIIPCASFDLTNLEQQKICFHYTNLQPLWEADNIRKSDKVPDIF